MKKIYTIVLLTIISISKLHAQLACTISDNGTANVYELNSGDVLCIESGVFSGSITNFDYNAEIRVAAGAIFQPASMQNVNGLLTNRGTTKFLNTFSLGSNFSIINDSAAIFYWNAPQNFTDAISIHNRKYGEMNFSAAFDLSQGSSALNEGVMKMTAPLFVQDGSILSNEGVIYLNKDFTANGVVYNSGIMKVTGFTTIGATSFFTNKCTYYGKNTFTNESNHAENYGYIYIYGSEINSKFLNNANFFNDEGGIIQCVDFDNYGDITGGGKFTAFQVSRNYGSFGNDGGGINFYDQSPTNNQIFDVQQVTPGNTVSKLSVSIYDSTYISNNCNQMIFPDFLNTPLPVLLTAFDATAVECVPNIMWTTAQEKNCQYFELQRKSETDNTFIAIAQLNAQGDSDVETSYNYKDEHASNGSYQYRLKIVDFDGKFAFSKVANVRVFCGNEQSTNVYPNPATDQINIALQTNNEDTYYFLIYDLTGRLVHRSSSQFSNGFNNYSVEISHFINGYYNLIVTNNIKTENFKFVKN